MEAPGDRDGGLEIAVGAFEMSMLNPRGILRGLPAARNDEKYNNFSPPSNAMLSWNNDFGPHDTRDNNVKQPARASGNM